MKFICNNCGFSAEIPEKRLNCPMCASNNVTVDESAVGEKRKDKKTMPEESFSEEKAAIEKNSSEDKKEVRKEKITLTDNFFDQKPNKEEQEIADVLKELYPDDEKKSPGFKMPDWRVLAGAGAGVVILFIIILSVFLGGSDDDDDVDVIDSEDVVEEKIEESAQEEDSEEVVEKEEEVVEKEEVAKVEPIEEDEVENSAEVEETEKEEVVAKVEEKKPVAAKPKPKLKPKRKKVVKRRPKPKKKKLDTAKKYSEFIRLGHEALGQKRYSDALHDYKNAMRLRPRTGKTYKFIGIAYAYLQNQNQACKNYRKYIKLTPNAKDKSQVQAFLEACP